MCMSITQNLVEEKFGEFGEPKLIMCQYLPIPLNN